MVDTTSLVAEVKTKGVTKATKELDKFGKEAQEAEKDTVNFGAAASKTFGAIKVGAVAFAGAATALGALSIKVANAQKEWQTLANIAGDSVDDFKATAFAAEQVGISAEKLADISKDTREKLGEFVATGGGGFKDFFEQVAPQIGITARELQGLSGTDVLQRVTSAMEAANIPMEQQSFYLESIASDTTNLIPLLQDESAELNRLTGEYNSLNDALKLTASDQTALKELSEEFDLLGDTAGNALSFLTSQFAPDIATFVNFITTSIPQATSAITEFFDEFRDPENRRSINSIQETIEDNLERIEELQNNNARRNKQGRRQEIADLKERNRLLEERKNILVEEQAVISSPDFSSGTGQQLAGTRHDDGAEISFDDPRIRIERLTLDEIYRLHVEQEERLDDLREEKARAEFMNRQMILSASSNLFGSLADLQKTYGKEQSNTYKALFATSKAFAIAESVIAIQQGIANSAKLGFPQNIPAIASTVAATSGLVSNISSISYDGGNFANGGVVGGSSFAGDNITANVNSGEMILNKGQQKNLFDLANGGGGAANVTVINNAPNSVARSETMSDGRVKVIVEEILNSEVLSPNSRFNKNLDKTRKVQRQL